MDLITKLQNQFTREQLYDNLKNKNIAGCSRLKKNDLAKLVAQHLSKETPKLDQIFKFDDSIFSTDKLDHHQFKFDPSIFSTEKPEQLPPRRDRYIEVREGNEKLNEIAKRELKTKNSIRFQLVAQVMLFPSKEVMMNELTSHPLWECTLVNPNYRYVKFFYFLTSNGSLSGEIRRIIEQSVSIHNFCRLLVKVYQKASDRIHRPSVNLTTAEIKDGLKFYGLDQTELLECVEVLESVYHKSVLRSQKSTRTIQQCSSHFPRFQLQLPSLESSSTSFSYSLPRPRHSSQQSFHLQNRERGGRYPSKRRRF